MNKTSSQRADVNQAGGMFSVQLYLNAMHVCMSHIQLLLENVDKLEGFTAYTL